MFIVYYWRTFTATVPGSVMRPVVCEKCSTEFHYELVRAGTGAGAALYGLGQKSAKARAEKAARKNLAKRLSRDVEMVPCPKCRWVNAAAIKAFRKQCYTVWTKIAVFTLFVAAVVGVIVLLTDIYGLNGLGKPRGFANPVLWYVLLSGVAVALIALMIRHALRWRIDPNRLVNGQPVVPPGTPPALVQQQTNDGHTIVVPVASVEVDLERGANWAVFRPGQLHFDAMCCVCLGASERWYVAPLRMAKTPLNVPICKACQWQITKRFLLRVAAGLLLAFLAAYVVSRLIARETRPDAAQFWIMTGFFTFFVVLVIAVTLIQLAPPYRVRMVDRARSIWKIKFKNPVYTAIMIRKIGQADGAFQAQR
ncbi:MAG: hypothetical protein FWD61_06525 [Phycisphaerales bacterium]|nr:hypothetical protein [Phycisphaerales bacterium]